jgi:N,N'-diacetyllegionaminate synthase
MNIAGHEIGKRPFLISEVGLNHNGSLDRAMEMIGAAKVAGVDAVKFQTFKAAGVCDAEQVYTYRQYYCQGIGAPILTEITEPRINIFRRCELPEVAWWRIKHECDKQGVIFLSTPQNPSDLVLLLDVGIPAIKIGSDDATNHEMLRYCARDDVGLPIILSTGMCDGKEIGAALDAIGRHTPCVLMVCTSEYPCAPDSVNVRRVESLRHSADAVGFSDHTIGTTAAIAATALGACVFECHFTLDHDLPGPDHWWSRDVSQLRAWVDAIHEAHVMLGDGAVKPSAKELEAKGKYQRTQPA